MAYIDGQPIRVGAKIKELPPEVYNTMDIPGVAAWAGVLVTRDEAEKAAEAWRLKTELKDAVFFAEIDQPTMAQRYHNTKKKRTRKKYEKRILAWFREAME